jgi:hypothetical protein
MSEAERNGSDDSTGVVVTTRIQMETRRNKGSLPGRERSGKPFLNEWPARDATLPADGGWVRSTVEVG